MFFFRQYVVSPEVICALEGKLTPDNSFNKFCNVFSLRRPKAMSNSTFEMRLPCIPQPALLFFPTNDQISSTSKMSWICRLSNGRIVMHRGESFLTYAQRLNAGMQHPCGVTDTRNVHIEVNNLLFYSGLTDTISIIKLKSLAAHLAPIKLMFSFSQTMVFNRLILSTKRAFYVNFSHKRHPTQIRELTA